MERDNGGKLGGDEVEEMQRAVKAWQAQATEAQQVCLAIVSAPAQNNTTFPLRHLL